jgi:hypothetical protein
MKRRLGRQHGRLPGLERKLAGIAAWRHDPRRDLQHQRQVVGAGKSLERLGGTLGGLPRQGRRRFARVVKAWRRGAASSPIVRPASSGSRADNASVSNPCTRIGIRSASRAAPSARACSAVRALRSRTSRSSIGGSPASAGTASATSAASRGAARTAPQ